MGQLGAPEILLILLVVVLLFGAKKLPELARGSGRALRIFKSETKGLIEDDKSEEKPELGTGAHPATGPTGATGASTTTTTHTVSASHPVEESGSSDSRY